MPKFIFASTKDSDMRYAVKTPITSSFFYIETHGKKIALLDKVDFGVIANPKAKLWGIAPIKSGQRKKLSFGIKAIPLEPLAKEAKKLKLKTSDRNKLAYYIFKKYGLMGKRVEVPIHFPLDMADFLRKKGAKLIPTFPFFPERSVKTRQEIGYIRESLAHTKVAFRTIENILRKSKIRGKRVYFKNKILTSEFLKQVAEMSLFENGMFDILGMIISCGKQTAIPHHSGAGPILPHQPIVCDIFPRHRASGYFADMTRTFVKGRPKPEIQKMYHTVLQAQIAAIKKISVSSADRHAVIRAKDIYEATAEVILKNGYHVSDTGFIHGLGHGVGLDIHEKPSLKPHSEDILAAGNVITIEPGLYYPHLGGIRIEDMILVTKTGCQNLTNYPKKLVIS
jgi:Xaa-Pro aminopeptidase